jgi:hypothetical protein
MIKDTKTGVTGIKLSKPLVRSDPTSNIIYEPENFMIIFSLKFENIMMLFLWEVLALVKLGFSIIIFLEFYILKYVQFIEN